MGAKKLGQKPSPVIPILMSSVLLVVLFLGVMSYMYGSLYRSSGREHNLKILAVDFDDSTIGSSLRAAYDRLQGSEFVTLDFQPASQFSEESISNAVCSQKYWGVIYTHSGATERFVAAVSGNSTTPYDPQDAITYAYSGVRYPVIGDAYIVPNLQQLAAITTGVLQSREAPALLATANLTNPAAAAALFQPIVPAGIVLSPANSGPRVLLNTITMVVPPLIQFFFIMAVDNISIAMHVFSPTHIRRQFLYRLMVNKTFGLVAALAVTAFIYAFREDWNLTGAHFAETWMCFWFYMDICYLVVDSFIGTVVPMKFAPFFIFTWIIMNVTSTLYPFELNPGFYRWGYALPAHNIWSLLMAVWSNGCISNLRVALPVCFAWWIVGHVTSAFAVRRKCITNAAPPPEDPPEDPTPNSSKLRLRPSDSTLAVDLEQSPEIPDDVPPVPPLPNQTEKVTTADDRELKAPRFYMDDSNTTQR